MFWNVSGGNGETDFLNFAQAGNGGYSFYTMKATITPHILASINSSGDIIPTGSIDITTGTGIKTTAGLITNTVAGYLYGATSNIQTQLNNVNTFITNLGNTSFTWNAQQIFNYALNTSSTTLPSYSTNSIGYSYFSNKNGSISNNTTISSNTITVLSVGIYMVYSSIILSVTGSTSTNVAVNAQIYFNGSSQTYSTQVYNSSSVAPSQSISLQPLPLCISVSTVNSTFQCQYLLVSTNGTYTQYTNIQVVKIA